MNWYIEKLIVVSEVARSKKINLVFDYTMKIEIFVCHGKNPVCKA